ncbi:PEP-CTERM sorting domain-containing protein [Lacipirellula parvula]|uniref:Ice-binding protein C-terminal domain-containing protein n=1 Tax=Lacipirellula parvula TaxID=2650471 RepID=A0A5K7X8Q8_9BACT|nr:PEP-CTERM sorting domain-containing protein [Lacipirellula parvula]BBO32918.1 hypothetical protein PLANPX_2530 [Lacipirellula parvula]
MRQLLFVLLVALLSSAAFATPYAEYNPATGDVTLKELNGLFEFQFNSKNGLLNKTIAGQSPHYSPTNAVAPVVSDAYVNGPGYILRWTPSPGETQLNFDSLTILHAVQPFTPHLNELQFATRFSGDRGLLLRELRVVPEPSTIAILGVGLLALAALRGRA